MSEYSVISERVGLGGARKVSAVNESTTYKGWGWSRVWDGHAGRRRWEGERRFVLVFYFITRIPSCKTTHVSTVVRVRLIKPA